MTQKCTRASRRVPYTEGAWQSESWIEVETSLEERKTKKRHHKQSKTSGSPLTLGRGRKVV